MEWIKSVLNLILDHSEFLAQVLSIVCFFGLLHFIDRNFPEATFKHYFIIFALVLGYSFWERVAYSVHIWKKQQTKAQNESVLTFTLTSQDANSVQINSTLVAGDNIPHLGNALLKQGQELLTDKYKQLEEMQAIKGKETE